MATSPPPLYPRRSSRSLPPSLHHSRSSSVESRPRGRTTYSQNRSPSQDSLYLSMDSSCGPIQRWDGLAREATEWNSLRHDPELYLPVGNCLVFLYAAGSSQRGPSFRIPYDLLLYSGCRPLIDRCLINSSTSEYHPASSTPPSYETVDYLSSSEENCCLLYLQAPTGLSRDESYVYHLATRNFFAWLLGVPLVGTDPVSALLDLKIRMDMWRDPGSGNFGALFDYVKEQGYGDFEALEIEMGKRLNADMHQANGTMGFPPPTPMMFNDQSRPQDEGKTSRRNSLTRKIRRKLSRSRTRENELPASTTQGPPNVQARLQTLRVNSYTHGPPPPSSDHISAAMERLIGPPSTQSVDIIPNVQNGKEEKIKKRRSWTHIAGSVWKRASMSDVRLPALQTQRPQPLGSSAFEEACRSPPVSAQAISTEPASAPVATWKRASVTDSELPPLQTQQPQPAISPATNASPSAPGPTSANSPQSVPVSPAVVSGEEKKKRRLSWANVSDKIYDIMMPPTSKDDLPPPTPPSQGDDSSITNKAAAVAAVSSSSPAEALPTTEATPASLPSAGRSATRSSSRHPSVHDFSTGNEICACCGKVRQPRPQSSAAPSRPTLSEVKDVKDVTDVQDVKDGKDGKGARGAFETLHNHMKARRNEFKSKSHKQIIIPDYGNGTRGLAANAGGSGSASPDAEPCPAKTRPQHKGRNRESRKVKTRSIDAVASPVEIHTVDARTTKTQSVEKTISVDAIAAPTEARAKDLKRLNAIPTDAVVLSTKVQPEVSVAVSAGPMLAAELVASPMACSELSTENASSNSSPLHIHKRSSTPASSHYQQRAPVGSPEPGVIKTDGSRGGDNDIHYRVPTATELATGSVQGRSSARPEMERLSPGPGAGEETFQVVDADFESNIECLLAQLEAAGIGEGKTTEKGKDKQKSLEDLEPRIGMPRLLYELA